MPNVGLFRGFNSGAQHSMRSSGAFLAQCVRAAFPGWTVLEQYDRPTLFDPSMRVDTHAVLFRIDRYLVPRRRFDGQRLDLLAISDHSDAHVTLKQRAARTFITCHDVLPRLLELGLVEGPRPSATGRMLLRANGRALERADRIVCVSHSTRNDLVSHFQVDPARVEVIHNPDLLSVDVESEEIPRDAIRLSEALAGFAPYILSVGGGKFYKNLKSVPKVLDILVNRLGVDVNWVVIGRRETPPGPLDGRIRFLAGLSARTLAQIYRSASAFYFPSLYEGFGLPVVEAQRFGVPVVCSDRGALPEVVGEGALIVPPHDHQGAAEALARVLTDEVERSRLIKAGQTNQLRFTLESRLALYVSALRRAARG